MLDEQVVEYLDLECITIRQQIRIFFHTSVQENVAIGLAGSAVDVAQKTNSAFLSPVLRSAIPRFSQRPGHRAGIRHDLEETEGDDFHEIITQGAAGELPERELDLWSKDAVCLRKGRVARIFEEQEKARERRQSINRRGSDGAAGVVLAAYARGIPDHLLQTPHRPLKYFILETSAMLWVTLLECNILAHPRTGQEVVRQEQEYHGSPRAGGNLQPSNNVAFSYPERLDPQERWVADDERGGRADDTRNADATVCFLIVSRHRASSKWTTSMTKPTAKKQSSKESRENTTGYRHSSSGTPIMQPRRFVAQTDHLTNKAGRKPSPMIMMGNDDGDSGFSPQKLDLGLPSAFHLSLYIKKWNGDDPEAAQQFTGSRRLPNLSKIFARTSKVAVVSTWIGLQSSGLSREATSTMKKSRGSYSCLRWD
ncbi:hypothetical protein OF83DRAFT_1086045 [Amylostereum chailletii]|nr:hypothetical protein OF83DRAFT_1086045 [Amylostereum chailletii]